MRGIYNTLICLSVTMLVFTFVDDRMVVFILIYFNNFQSLPASNVKYNRFVLNNKSRKIKNQLQFGIDSVSMFLTDLLWQSKTSFSIS